jgi:ABC-type glycerol-3-phosphate transport system substrate-binding protein
MSGTSDEYKATIQSAIDAGGESVPSIFAADNDVARYFMAQDYVVPVSNVGITDEMYANAYDYTVEYATVDGQLMGVTWQATPGVVAYRTDIAEEVLGFSDSESVQAAIGTWDDFFAVAEMMKSAGYYMVSGSDDIRYAVLDDKTSPWVIDGALNIDPAINTYLEYSKKLYDNGYTKKTMMWSSDWTANMADDVFCYFGCTWFVPWSLYIEDTDATGK